MLAKYFSLSKKSVFLLTLIFVCSCQVIDAKKNDAIQGEMNQFILALLDKNEEYLVEKYLNSSPTFSSNGKFTKEIVYFLYGKDDKSEKKSVLDLFSKDNFKTKIIWQNDKVFTLIVVHETNYDKLDDLGFLQQEWMRKYLACEFISKNEGIVFYQNVCFAETGGPFPIDYDI